MNATMTPTRTATGSPSYRAEGNSSCHDDPRYRPRCAEWNRSGYCYQYQSVRAYCRRTCGLCSHSNATLTPTDWPTHMPSRPGGPCQDSQDSRTRHACPHWKRAGYCARAEIQRVCARTCGLCSASNATSAPTMRRTTSPSNASHGSFLSASTLPPRIGNMQGTRFSSCQKRYASIVTRNPTPSRDVQCSAIDTFATCLRSDSYRNAAALNYLWFEYRTLHCDTIRPRNSTDTSTPTIVPRGYPYHRHHNHRRYIAPPTASPAKCDSALVEKCETYLGQQLRSEMIVARIDTTGLCNHLRSYAECLRPSCFSALLKAADTFTQRDCSAHLNAGTAAPTGRWSTPSHGSAYGSGYGSGHGSAYGSGYSTRRRRNSGYGSGYGNAYGSGYGTGYLGFGHGSAYGSGYSTRRRRNSGYGSGYGNAYGSGYGSGYGSRYNRDTVLFAAQ